MKLTAPWQGWVDQRRAEKARREAERKREERRNLLILGAMAVVSMGGIGIGALLEDDTPSQPVDRHVTAAASGAVQQATVPSLGPAAGTASATAKPAALKPAQPASARPATPATRKPTKKATTAPPVEDDGDGPDDGVDPRFATCAKANAAGYGPYFRGEIEYTWYRDRDKDGQVCE